MNLTQDISDIELKQRWRLYWLHCIFEFSNVRLQNMAWIEKDEATWPHESWESSFEECFSAYYDNLSLLDGYKKAIHAGNVTQVEADKAHDFHQLASLYIEPSEDPRDILKDLEWIELVDAAKVFWDYLKGSVTEPREIELIQKLEKDFA